MTKKMSHNIFFKKEKIEDFLNDIILHREIFRKKTDIDIWKSAYLSIYGICNNLDTQIKRKYWKKTPLEKPIKELRNISKKFEKISYKHGISHGEWCGCSEECKHIIDDYKNRCIPIIKKIGDLLDDNNHVKEEIKNRFNS